ncbi:hypothetical protein EON62_05675, partial [archaeon]
MLTPAAMDAPAWVDVKTECDQYLLGCYYYGRVAPVVEVEAGVEWKNHLVIRIPNERVGHLSHVTCWMVKEGTEEPVSKQLMRLCTELDVLEELHDAPAGRTCFVVRQVCDLISWNEGSLPKRPAVLCVELYFDDLPHPLHFECEPTFYRTNVVAKTSLRPLRITSLSEWQSADVAEWLSPRFGRAATTLARLKKWVRQNVALQDTFLSSEAAHGLLLATEEELAARRVYEQPPVFFVAIAGAGRAGMRLPDCVGSFHSQGDHTSDVSCPASPGAGLASSFAPSSDVTCEPASPAAAPAHDDSDEHRPGGVAVAAAVATSEGGMDMDHTVSVAAAT